MRFDDAFRRLGMRDRRGFLACWFAGTLFAMKLRAALVLSLAVVALVAACGGGGKSTAKVGVGLKEWEVDVQPAEVKPGKVAFEVRNNGSRVHQLLVVKSDLPLSQLPTAADNRADEAKLNVAGSIESLQPGGTASLELELFPGKYILLCNLVSQNASGPADPHYLNSMAASFFVLDE